MDLRQQFVRPDPNGDIGSGQQAPVALPSYSAIGNYAGDAGRGSHTFACAKPGARRFSAPSQRGGCSSATGAVPTRHARAAFLR